MWPSIPNLVKRVTIANAFCTYTVYDTYDKSKLIKADGAIKLADNPI
jgi:hypothetical protein